MDFLKATLFFSSLVHGSALSLVPASHLEQPSVKSNNESRQILDSLHQSGNSPNATTSMKLKAESIIVCDGALGRGLSFDSCSDAIDRLDSDTVPQTWGMRGTGVFSRSLPRYTISSKCPGMRMSSSGI